jgi:hypothetical protein
VISVPEGIGSATTINQQRQQKKPAKIVVGHKKSFLYRAVSGCEVQAGF